MAVAVETCWTLIRDATAGIEAARERFVRLYEPVVRAYLAKRWRDGSAAADISDATQDVFLALLQPGGALDKFDGAQGNGFRAYLFGIVRNVALRYDAKRRPITELPADLVDDETGLAEAFDRAWAKSILREAARVQEENAIAQGSRAMRRVELLKLRFHEGLPIRAIATQWKTDPAALHHEYAVARDEFRAALRVVVALNHPEASDSQLDQFCVDILNLL